jgi:hypothetical protein
MWSLVNLKSHLAIPFNQSYLRSHLAASFNWNKKKNVQLGQLEIPSGDSL